MDSDPFLFVSHVSEDQAAALEIVGELERRGVRCRIAPRDVRPGSRFDDEISDALDGCAAMLLIFSEHCNNNEYIYREVTVAGESHKIIIPFRIDDAQPQRGLRVRLSDLHWINGFASRERAIDELIHAFAPSALDRQQLGLREAGPTAEAARQAEEERRGVEAARQGDEERRQAEAVRQADEEKRQAEEKERQPKAARQRLRAQWLGWRKIAGLTALFLIIVGGITGIVYQIEEARLEELRKQQAEMARRIDVIVAQNEPARRAELQKQQEQQEQQEQSGSPEGAVIDEARAAGRAAQTFPAADEDYFKGMDGGVKLTSDETKGRNMWLVWTGGNDRLWDQLTTLAFGSFDLLKVLSSYPGLRYNRDNRWNYFGLVNEPCFTTGTGPDPQRYGLWLDRRKSDCPADPFADEQKYPGVVIGARGKNLPVGSYYGYPSGILGLRLFPNPAFDTVAAKRWDPKRFYEDPSYYLTKDLVRPYRVGISCGFCHVGPTRKSHRPIPTCCSGKILVPPLAHNISRSTASWHGTPTHRIFCSRYCTRPDRVRLTPRLSPATTSTIRGQ